jgi:hypothetical protein
MAAAPVNAFVDVSSVKWIGRGAPWGRSPEAAARRGDARGATVFAMTSGPAEAA